MYRMPLPRPPLRSSNALAGTVTGKKPLSFALRLHFGLGLRLRIAILLTSIALLGEVIEHLAATPSRKHYAPAMATGLDVVKTFEELFGGFSPFLGFDVLGR